MILYFELTANCSLIRSESSVWKVCVKKYGFFYEDEDDTSVHDNPEVIDLEFMQYAKNDISALLDQSEAGNVDKDLTELEKDVKKVDKDVPKVNKNVQTSNKKEKQVPYFSLLLCVYYKNERTTKGDDACCEYLLAFLFHCASLNQLQSSTC